MVQVSVEALGVALGIGSLAVPAIWAAVTYSRSRRSERAEWLHALFKDVYFCDYFDSLKTALEYDYEARLERLLELRINDRHVPISDADVDLLIRLDDFLNYIEHVLSLQHRRLISERERRVIFDYWPQVIAEGHRFAALRRYISMCGYERITGELQLSNVDYLAVYGSLMRGLSPEDQPDVMDKLRFLGEVELNGTLYEVDGGTYRYPGIELGTWTEQRVLHPGRRSTGTSASGMSSHSASSVVGELYEVTDMSVLSILDDWEEYDANSPTTSPYRRTIVRVFNSALGEYYDAWVYAGNHPRRLRSACPGVRDWRSVVADQEDDGE